MSTKQVFFHFDLDAFFASVEQKENPSYKGRPVIIGHVAPRCVVSTCSYEARKFGIHSAMPTLTAYKLCPQGIFIDGNMQLYCNYSRRVMNILKEYGEVNQVSIDEAWMDMTGTGLLFGKPKDIALKIKERIKSEIGITMSIGIAPNPFLAKMASDYNKPDGLCLVSESKKIMFIDAIGLKKIWGLGKSGLSYVESKGFKTPAQIRDLSFTDIQNLFGASMGDFLYNAVRGIDPGTFQTEAKSHSISTETTFFNDITDRQTLVSILLSMSHFLMSRSLDENIIAKTIGLKLRWGDFRTITVQKTPEDPIINADKIYEISKELLDKKWKEGQGIRLIGLGLYQTYKSDIPIQDSLFSLNEHKKRELDKIAHSLNSKGITLKKAGELENHS